MYAKTGVLYMVPRHISKYGRPLPYFMKYRGAYYANQKLSMSGSNMNKLCYTLEKWDKRLRWERIDTSKFDYTIMIDDGIEYTDEEFAAVREIFFEYLAEARAVSKFGAMCRNYKKYRKELAGKITEQEAKRYEIDWGTIYEKYKDKCLKVCSDCCKLANIAVRLCYEDYPKKDKKFLWVVASQGVLENIKQVRHKLPKRVYDGIGDMYLGKAYMWVDYEGDD